MMKLVNKSSNSFLKHTHFAPKNFRGLLYSTQTQSTPSDTLYHRFLACIIQQRGSIIPVIDKWVAENRPLDQKELTKIIKILRSNGGFKPALEIAEWMSDTKPFDLTLGHNALQLDLISKAQGLEQAEIYFNRLENNLPVYGTLLNCYVNAKCLDKAEALMEKIKKSKSCTTLIYNSMLRLYSQTGHHEKLNSLVREMEDNGFAYDAFSYSIILNAYADSCEIGKMEKLLMKMEIDPCVTVTYFTYVTVAKGYVTAGDIEKASIALKKSEHLIKGRGYSVIMTLYATMKKREDVYRLWDLIKNKTGGKLHNKDYLSMISSLSKMDDLDGVENVFKEWEENNTLYDVRIPNFVISVYCKKGRVREAELVLGRVVGNGLDPSARTWSVMGLGYCKSGLMEKAVEMTKKSFVASFGGWKPHMATVAACLEYLKKKGDEEGTREMVMLLEKCGESSVGFKKRIERYLYGGEDRHEPL